MVSEVPTFPSYSRFPTYVADFSMWTRPSVVNVSVGWFSLRRRYARLLSADRKPSSLFSCVHFQRDHTQPSLSLTRWVSGAVECGRTVPWPAAVPVFGHVRWLVVIMLPPAAGPAAVRPPTFLFGAPPAGYRVGPSRRSGRGRQRCAIAMRDSFSSVCCPVTVTAAAAGVTALPRSRPCCASGPAAGADVMATSHAPNAGNHPPLPTYPPRHAPQTGSGTGTTQIGAVCSATVRLLAVFGVRWRQLTQDRDTVYMSRKIRKFRTDKFDT